MRVVAKGKVTHKQSIIFFLFTAEYITMPVLKVIFGTYLRFDFIMYLIQR